MGHDTGSKSWRDHVKRAIEIAGNQRLLAGLCGVSQHAIWNVLRKSDGVSPKLAIAIVNATNGEVRFSDLSPELFAVVSDEVMRELAA